MCKTGLPAAAYPNGARMAVTGAGGLGGLGAGIGSELRNLCAYHPSLGCDVVTRDGAVD